MNMCVCILEIIWLIMMKMKIEMKNKLHRYNIKKSKSMHGHRYSKYKKLSQYDEDFMY